MAADHIATLLAHRGPSSSVLLIVDQLEELFTLAGADERASFLAALRALRAVPRCVVICTLRADFFGTHLLSPSWFFGNEMCGDRRHGRLMGCVEAPMKHP